MNGQEKLIQGMIERQPLSIPPEQQPPKGYRQATRVEIDMILSATKRAAPAFPPKATRADQPPASYPPNRQRTSSDSETTDSTASVTEYEFRKNNKRRVLNTLAAISLVGLGATVWYYTANSTEADASTLNLQTLSQDVFDCKTPVATTTISSEADMVWQITTTDGKLANLGPSIQGDNGAKSRYPRVWFDQAPVDYAACITEAMGPNPISIKNDKLWVNLGDVTLLPSFKQSKTQGAESLPVITPPKNAKTTFSPEEAKKVVAASASENNGKIALEALRIDTLKEKPCGSDIQTASVIALKNTLRALVAKQGLEINIEVTGNPTDPTQTYAAGKPTAAYTPEGFAVKISSVSKCSVEKSKE